MKDCVTIEYNVFLLHLTIKKYHIFFLQWDADIWSYILFLKSFNVPLRREVYMTNSVQDNTRIFLQEQRLLEGSQSAVINSCVFYQFTHHRFANFHL